MVRKNSSSAPAGKRKIAIGQKSWRYIYRMNTEVLKNSDHVAIKDGIASYTYDQMFRLWERYAAVFTAMKMTKEEHARVGLIGSGAAEVIFAFYGLNMVGAEVSLLSPVDSLNIEKLINTVKNEKLTHLIMTDDFLQESTLCKLLEKKDAIGLMNVFVIHIPMKSRAVPELISNIFETRSMRIRMMHSPVYLDYLLMYYGDGPIRYDSDESNDTAVIVHTSGTTGGAGKPVVLSDRALNAVGKCLSQIDDYDFIKNNLVGGLTIDLSNAYGLADQVHMPFALGGTVVTIPGVCLNPFYPRGIPEYGITLLFCTGFLIDMWMKYPEEMKLDFSGLKGIVFGGTFISANDKQRYYEFFRKHGCGEIPMVNGYGISELGGVVTLSSPDLADESIGSLVPGMDALLYDEDEEIYHTMKDVPCSGVLYLRSDTMAQETLDGETIIKTEIIKGRTYICTNDLVSADEKGQLTYLGRANRYFINNEGIKYQAGRVETEIARQTGIESCGIVPVYDKRHHDNIPMLCVNAGNGIEEAKNIVTQALLNVFVKEKSLGPENVPGIILLAAEELPRNTNGKINLYEINKGRIKGRKYQVELKKCDDRITNIRLVHSEENVSDVLETVYKDIAKEIIPKPVYDIGEKIRQNVNHLTSSGSSDPKMVNPYLTCQPYPQMVNWNYYYHPCYQMYCWYNNLMMTGLRSSWMPYIDFQNWFRPFF